MVIKTTTLYCKQIKNSLRSTYFAFAYTRTAVYLTRTRLRKKLRRRRPRRSEYKRAKLDYRSFAIIPFNPAAAAAIVVVLLYCTRDVRDLFRAERVGVRIYRNNGGGGGSRKSNGNGNIFSLRA